MQCTNVNIVQKAGESIEKPIQIIYDEQKGLISMKKTAFCLLLCLALAACALPAGAENEGRLRCFLLVSEEADAPYAAQGAAGLPDGTPLPAARYTLYAGEDWNGMRAALLYEAEEDTRVVAFTAPAEALAELTALLRESGMAALNREDRWNGGEGLSLELAAVYDNYEILQFDCDGDLSLRPEGWNAAPFICWFDALAEAAGQRFLSPEKAAPASLESLVRVSDQSGGGMDGGSYEATLQADESGQLTLTVTQRVFFNDLSSVRVYRAGDDALEQLRQIARENNMTAWADLPMDFTMLALDAPSTGIRLTADESAQGGSRQKNYYISDDALLPRSGRSALRALRNCLLQWAVEENLLHSCVEGLDAMTGLWADGAGGDANTLNVLAVNGDTVTLELSFYRLMAFGPLTVTLDGSRGEFTTENGIPCEITFAENAILLEVGDAPNVYFDQSAHQFLGDYFWFKRP